MNAGQPEQAGQTLEKLNELLGDSVDLDVVRSLAEVHQEMGDEETELKWLEQLARLSADDFPKLRRLMEMYRQREQWDQLMQIAGRSLDVQPLLPVAHEYLVLAAERSNQLNQAKQSLEALSVMDPVDPAGIFYKTARAYRQAEDLEKAKRFVLKALDEAPHYRDAQKMLLELTAPEKAERSQGDRPQTDRTQAGEAPADSAPSDVVETDASQIDESGEEDKRLQ